MQRRHTQGKLSNKRLERALFAGFLTLLVVPFQAPAASNAAAYQSLDSIRDAVKTFIAGEHRGEKVSEIQIGHLDPRLRLARCDRALDTFRSNGSRGYGAVTVGVRCHGAKPWTLYVSANIVAYGTVYTLAGSRPRGAILTRNDLKPVTRNLAELRPGYIAKADDAVGMALRRPLRMGEILDTNALKRPTLVKRGEQVQVVAQSGGVRVSSKGTAMEDGARGDRIRIKNVTSKRVIQARVVAANRVTVMR